MKTILLTGGNGFIGRNILESFLVDKYRIEAPSSKELNLIDERNVQQYFASHHPDIVIHAAVKPGHRNVKDSNNLFFSNTRMFFNLERYSANYEKMLVIGSGAIYDNRNYCPKMKEEDWLVNMPIDEHGYCKYVCEKVIANSKNIYDLRVFGVFGRYEDYAIRFISNAICKTLFDLPVTIKQNRKFDYLYIDDLMPVLDWFIGNNPNHKAYNVTPDHSISLFDLALLIREISGKQSLPIIVAEKGMGLEYSGDNSRLRAECDIRFLAIESAVRQLYHWYESQQGNLKKELLLIDK